MGIWINRALAAPVLAVALTAGAGHAADRKPTFNDEIRQVREVRGAPALSPDGTGVLTLITDSTADGGRTHVWLLGTDGKSMRQLTRSATATDAGESAPAWSPDGRQVYFLASRGGARRLLRLPLDGGEAVPYVLGRAEGGGITAGWAVTPKDNAASATEFNISPDGRTIALLATDGDTDAQSEREAKKDDAVRVGHDGISKTRLYLIDVASGDAREVALPDNADSASWNETSTRLLVATQPESDDLGPGGQVWRVTASGGKPERLAALPATAQSPAWTPKGDAIVYLAQCQDDAPPGCEDLYVSDGEGRSPRNLTRGLQGSLAGGLTVSRDGRSVVTLVSYGFDQKLVRIALADGALAAFAPGQPSVTAAATNPAQSGWVITAGGAQQPTTVYALPRLESAAVPLATPPLVPGHWKPVAGKRITWRSDNLTIEGMLYLPPQAKGRIPLVVNVHGGPAGRFGDIDSNLVNLLVDQGWAVLQTNPRGSEGYGVSFLAANKNDLGGGDYRDIMAGVDAVLAGHAIDPDRMALIGYSYGGEMAGFVAGKTDRFKALVSGAPVIDQFSEYGTEDSSWYDRWYYGKPWVNFADAWRQSPLSTAGKAKTPFLLVQGTDDVTDPQGQSQEMYRALKQEGVVVELILYPRSGHPTLGANFSGRVSREPWHGVDVRRRMVSFIQQAFDGSKTPEAK